MERCFPSVFSPVQDWFSTGNLIGVSPYRLILFLRSRLEVPKPLFFPLSFGPRCPQLLPVFLENRESDFFGTGRRT